MWTSRFFTILVGGLAAVACAESPTQPRATGELGPWTAGAALPTPRANHCSAAIGDWLLVIGGNHAEGSGFVTTDEIHAAKLVDGVLGPWQLAGRTPSAVAECAATGDGSTLYIVGGLYERATDGGQVWTATLDDAGVLGTFTSLAPLPPGTAPIGMEAAVRNGELLVTDTHVPMSGDITRTLHTRLDRIEWDEVQWDFGFRAQAQYAFTDDHAYAIGGYHDPALGALADVSTQSLTSGAAGSTTALPAPVGFGEAVAVDDWLFVVGGRAQVFGAPGTSSVYAAQLADDGSIATWQTLAPLPVARTNHELALVDDYLVLTGGAAMGPGDDAVLVAQVR